MGCVNGKRLYRRMAYWLRSSILFCCLVSINGDFWIVSWGKIFAALPAEAWRLFDWGTTSSI